MLILQGAPDSIRLVCNTLITSSNLVVASEESSKDGSFFCAWKALFYKGFRDFNP